MITRPELRSQARETLRGKWTQPVLATLIILLLACFTQGGGRTHSPYLISGVVLVELFIIANLQYGYDVALLRFNRSREDSVNEMFRAAFKEDYGRVLGMARFLPLRVIRL